MTEPICPFCNQPVSSSERIYREVLGWVDFKRMAGGTNTVRLQQQTGKFAHWVCVDRVAKGRQGQEELFPSGT